MRKTCGGIPSSLRGSCRKKEKKTSGLHSGKRNRCRSCWMHIIQQLPTKTRCFNEKSNLQAGGKIVTFLYFTIFIKTNSVSPTLPACAFPCPVFFLIKWWDREGGEAEWMNWRLARGRATHVIIIIVTYISRKTRTTTWLATSDPSLSLFHHPKRKENNTNDG